ncbi:MAG: hypothetical protein ABR537_01585 [Gemmatimonadales bacterium]
MAKRTRIFLLASAGVLTAVLATGLVAWAGGAVAGSNAPAEIAYVPGDAQMVAYADVRQVMNSPFHDRFREFETTSPASPDGLEARTGIQFDKDVDAVLIASSGTRQAPTASDRALIIARGRFDTVRIEALMRERGAQIEQYRGKRLVIVKDEKNDAALTFAEAGLVLFGPGDGVRGALDAKAGAAPGISANGEFMALVNDVDDGTAWSVAKFDSISGRAPLPGGVINQLPPINWLAASGRIDSRLHGLVRAEAQDERSAQDLRDVVQGFLSLARLQGSRDPAYKGMLDSVALNAQGKSVSLSFDLPPSALDAQSRQGGAVRRR